MINTAALLVFTLTCFFAVWFWIILFILACYCVIMISKRDMWRAKNIWGAVTYMISFFLCVIGINYSFQGLCNLAEVFLK